MYLRISKSFLLSLLSFVRKREFDRSSTFGSSRQAVFRLPEGSTRC